YRNCMSRLSTFAVSTFTPALKVLSSTRPVRTFLSLVRTNAPPLPGLTCWNSITVQSCPSRLSTRPFFRSFVVATGSLPCRVELDRTPSAEESTVPRAGSREEQPHGRAHGGRPQQRGQRPDHEPLRGPGVLAELRVPPEALDRDHEGDARRVAGDETTGDGEALEDPDPGAAAQGGVRGALLDLLRHDDGAQHRSR